MNRQGCQGCRDGVPLPFAFTMAFQPIIDAQAHRVWGYEALVRGTDGAGAGEILSRVDDTNRYKFDQACRVKALSLAGSLFDAPDTMLSINFMPNAVYEPAACIRATLEAARQAGFSHRQIMFEFTENERMVDVNHVRRIVAEYRKQGFVTALDDFGAGYAGLGLLAELQPDLIKLDMHLIRGLDTSHPRSTIIRHLVAMAHDLGVKVLAEGVETVSEFEALQAAGITLFQGYLFARPTVERLPEVNWPAPGALRPADPAPAALQAA